MHMDGAQSSQLAVTNADCTMFMHTFLQLTDVPATKHHHGIVLYTMSTHCDCLPMLGTAVQQFILIPGFRVHVDHIQLPQVVCIVQDSSPHKVRLHNPDTYSCCVTYVEHSRPCASYSETWLGADVPTISRCCYFDSLLHCVWSKRLKDRQDACLALSRSDHALAPSMLTTKHKATKSGQVMPGMHGHT